MDPETETVRTYRPGKQVAICSGGLLDLDDVLPGFQLDVTELFPE
jgi:hypothetical protein